MQLGPSVTFLLEDPFGEMNIAEFNKNFMVESFSLAIMRVSFESNESGRTERIFLDFLGTCW